MFCLTSSLFYILFSPLPVTLFTPLKSDCSFHQLNNICLVCFHEKIKTLFYLWTFFIHSDLLCLHVPVVHMCSGICCRCRQKRSCLSLPLCCEHWGYICGSTLLRLQAGVLRNEWWSQIWPSIPPFVPFHSRSNVPQEKQLLLGSISLRSPCAYQLKFS